MTDKECWETRAARNPVYNGVYNGKEYYLNLETGKSQWGLPLLSDEELPLGWEKHMSSKFKTYYENTKTGETQWAKPQKSDEIIMLPKGWTTGKSRVCNNTYYRNTTTGLTQWEIPSAEAEENSIKYLNPDNIKIEWSQLKLRDIQLVSNNGTKKTGYYEFYKDDLSIISSLEDDIKKCYIMINKCKAPANRFVLDRNQKLPPGIKLIVSNIQDEIQKPPSFGRRNMFVLPSQLNAAEYPSQNTIVKYVHEYLGDGTGGPRGQLGADPAIAQFIIDNASNVKRPKGINNVRLMGDIKGVTLKNGYLQVEDTADTKEFAKRLPDMTVLGVRDVPVRGLDKTLKTFVKKDHTVDLIYGSAIPIGGKDALYDYGNSDHVNVKNIAFLTLFAQYVGAMRLAVTRRNCDLIMMPLGGSAFSNPLEIIRSAIINAYNFMKDELENADVRVAVLAWEYSTPEKDIFYNPASNW